MRKTLFLSLAGLALATSCKKDDNNNNDVTPPVIAAAEGRPEIRPLNNEVRSDTTDYVHVRFSVSDESGVKEILIDVHDVFDGHTHGKTSSFNKLSYRKIIQANGAKNINIDSWFDDIYWAGPNSEVTGNVLAGPYDFIIAATDIHGNQTSSSSNTNYTAQFFIERSYALTTELTNLVNGELEGNKNQPLEVKGAIQKGAHSESSNIAFVWVLLKEEHEHINKTKGEEIYERMWGTSMWRAGMNGAALPSTSNINLETLLSGADAIILPNETGNFELMIWVEDVNGNITQRMFEVHVN